jgi:hypothetical protein
VGWGGRCVLAPQWAALFGLSDAGTALLIALMPYAFGLYVGIAVGCGALRSVLTGMALVRVPSIVQVRGAGAPRPNPTERAAPGRLTLRVPRASTMEGTRARG